MKEPRASAIIINKRGYRLLPLIPPDDFVPEPIISDRSEGRSNESEIPLSMLSGFRCSSKGTVASLSSIKSRADETVSLPRGSGPDEYSWPDILFSEMDEKMTRIIEITGNRDLISAGINRILS